MCDWRLFFVVIGLSSMAFSMQPYDEWGSSAHQAEIYPFSSSIGYVGGLFDGRLPELCTISVAQEPIDMPIAPAVIAKATVLKRATRFAGASPLVVGDLRKEGVAGSCGVFEDMGTVSVRDAAGASSAETSTELVNQHEAHGFAQGGEQPFARQFALLTSVDKKHAQSFEVTCACCGKNYVRLEAFMRHLFVKHDRLIAGCSPYRCPIFACKKIYFDHDSLLRHLQEKHKES